MRPLQTQAGDRDTNASEGNRESDVPKPVFPPIPCHPATQCGHQRNFCEFVAVVRRLGPLRRICRNSSRRPVGTTHAASDTQLCLMRPALRLLI